MPWTIIPTDSQFCVHKENEDGTPGERVACHDTREAAEAQRRALYASEGGGEKAANFRSYTYNGVTVQATGRRPSSRDDKKYERTVRSGDSARVVHYGDPNLPMQRDIPERRASFLARHNCSEKRDPFAPGFWACLDWQRTDEGKSMNDDDVQPLPEPKAIKMLGQNRVGGYAVLWGDENARDLDGEFFTPDTAELTAIFKAVGRLPFLYDHARDDALKTTPVGVVDVMEPDDVGLWYEAQLERANKYVDALRKMVGDKKLGTSSGTFGQTRKADENGRITRWPIAEISGTPTPADWRQMTRPIEEIKAAYKSLDLQLPDQLAVEPDLDIESGAETAEAKAASKTAPAVDAAVDDVVDGETDRTNTGMEEGRRILLDLLALELDTMEK